MIKGDCPCYGCEDRSITCHSECKKYIDWKAEHDARREQQAKERAFKQEYNDFKQSVIKKVRKNKR